MASSIAPPVLSTPAEHILEDPVATAFPLDDSSLSDEQLYIQYEIPRTIREIRDGRWRKVALQFPDDMLVDAPRVFERLRDGVRKARKEAGKARKTDTVGGFIDVTDGLEKTTLDGMDTADTGEESEHRLTILADTSYGACCVDEVAAEHVDAEVVVHYGRSCLSPTARLPVIYVFTSKPLDLDVAVQCFKATYKELGEKVCLMADIPYSHHIPDINEKLRDEGYTDVFATEVVRDPSSLLPNRTVPGEVQEEGSSDKLQEYSIFHISEPPTSLLLILSSRVKRINILRTSSKSSSGPLEEATTTALLRRRYALVTRISAVPILGILINTLSVKNYMDALQHCQNLISDAGKKFYVFVVGKVNAAKLANFSEIGAWVVIGCWESSLIESKEFFAPVITPFELELALQGDQERQWSGKWVADFSEVLAEATRNNRGGGGAEKSDDGAKDIRDDANGEWNEQESDDEPPDFDLRTGRYVSRSRPMGRPKPHATPQSSSNGEAAPTAPPLSALVQRAKGDIATVNGAVSPAAEFLRSKRTWHGLGSDYEVAYERSEDGRIRGAAVEEGRSGIARGYAIGESDGKT
ncbi:Diphthamide biosynthesis protein 2 [Vermiconidia calcicola]|uniref:Diphthamide biosynthesis protein 2 n=1 Tax=Vermiconidia calcicola TaxID=1690605 RepID=A0ACC3NC60_9PEZI|nr:Diphthamide biosynthesis protein 2 [Vermiconidia calcicola]